MIELFNDTISQDIYDILYDNPEAIVYLKNRYQTDRLWKFCIEKEPKVFGKMRDPSVEMCEYALDIDGANLFFIKDIFTDIPITKRMVYIALRTYPGAIQYAPPEIITEEMLDIAFDSQPSLITSFRNLSYAYLSKKVKENPSIIRYIWNPGEDLICSALSADPNLCVYFETLTPRMINIITDIKPDMAELYTNTLESEIIEDAESCETGGTSESCEWEDSY